MRLMSQARQIHAYALAARRGLARRTPSPWSSAPSRRWSATTAVGTTAGLDLLHTTRRRRRRRAPRPLHPCFRPAGDRLLCRGDRRPRGACSGRRDAGVHRAATWRRPRAAASSRSCRPTAGCAGRTRTCTCSRACFPCGNARGQERYLRADDGTVRPVRHALLPSRSRRLGEYFTADLKPVDGVIGSIVEPGHHHEWVWLLRRFEQASGRSVQAYVDALYGHRRSLRLRRAGMIVDELLVDGTPRAGVAPHLAGRRGDQGEPGRGAAVAGRRARAGRPHWPCCCAIAS